ncbi:Uncharacterised protein [Mycobacterium tuberculosis]|uniref:Uncharacterized protein n=1 Tax=Mycobacterium tuberculosis TaxID=1773 RepID=A0A655JFE5_MYCTX|nr:Uncharacterised protein [Mycobacterium tuberculosis]COW82186.1 Uncharacterised protein [Mycobacterium tuberculosis]
MISKMTNNRIVIANSMRLRSRCPVRFRSATVAAGPVRLAVSVEPATWCSTMSATRAYACLDWVEPRSPGRPTGRIQA